MEHSPYVGVTGDPYEIGRGHGERLRDALLRQLDEVLGIAGREASMDRVQALAWADQQLPKLERTGGADWIAELQELADGARMSLAEAGARSQSPAMPRALRPGRQHGASSPHWRRSGFT